jgi:DNA-binding XRE family transcriptional regulator
MTSLTLIKIARMYQRLTLDDVEDNVGKKVGLSKHMFTRIENGTASANQKTQLSLCKFLQVRPTAAFGSSGKAKVIRWKHILQIQETLDRG